jgi:hypothetical protein
MVTKVKKRPFFNFSSYSQNSLKVAFLIKFYLLTLRKGKSEITIELVHFGCMIPTNNALKELGQKGYRPVEFHELLALIKEHSDFDFPIAALGSIWKQAGGNYVAPCFLDHPRRIVLNCIKGDWPEF